MFPNMLACAMPPLSRMSIAMRRSVLVMGTESPKPTVVIVVNV